MNGRLVGIEFLVQTTKSLEEAREAVDAFITEYMQKLQNIPAEELEVFKKSVLSLLKKKHVRLEEEYQDYKREIDRRRFQYDLFLFSSCVSSIACKFT